jgi:polyribonucleotide nucleotidyltransferase
MSKQEVTVEFGGRTVTLQTGKMARQAGGSVLVTAGDSVVLVTTTVAKQPREGTDFLPLTVMYQEKTFAAGKIPGGFFKREARPSESQTLTSRFIDRTVRPLFPKGFYNEMQTIATVLSVDEENEADILAMAGASASLMLSEAPFNGPIAGARVGRIDGQFVCNPAPEKMEESDIDLIVAGSESAVVMVEGGALEVSEADMIAAIEFGHQSIQPMLAAQKELAQKAAKTKIQVDKNPQEEAFRTSIDSDYGKRLGESFNIAVKQDRNDAISEIKVEAKEKLLSDESTVEDGIAFDEAFKAVESKLMRQLIVKGKKRIDGRGMEDIRPISCEVALLPRVHGSALFTRGETQALVTTTLGSEDDAQRIDSLTRDYKKSFMLHYNFPPFSVGEVRRLAPPGRREIGHGALAERAIRPMIPDTEICPYTLRIVSEVLESNGSSSMATVCGASLSLLDAGVKIERPVAGIAMGLVKEGDESVILSDILGDEDHLGDMDFKVTGTEKGITALQMDIKIDGVDQALLGRALEQAKHGRMHILSKMNEAIAVPRTEMSPHAPRIHTMKINPAKIKDLIGPGGKHIKGLVEETGAKIDVDDTGSVKIFSTSEDSLNLAIARVEELTSEPILGRIYDGRVVKIMEYGAFVQIMPNNDGLLHISQIDFKRIEKVTDVLQEGDRVPVKVIKIDPSGKVSLSRTEALKDQDKESGKAAESA